MTRRNNSVILNMTERVMTYHTRENATLKRRKQRKLLIFNGIFDDSLRIKLPMTMMSKMCGTTGIRIELQTASASGEPGAFLRAATRCIVVLTKSSRSVLWNSSATPKFFLSRKRELTNGKKVRILVPSSSGNCYEQDTTSPQHRFQKAVGCARRQQGAGRLSPASSFGKSGFL